MLDRRSALLAGLALAAATASGCSRVPPPGVTPETTDPRTYSPVPTAATRTPLRADPAQLARLESLRSAVERTRRAGPDRDASEAELATLDWCGQVVAAQLTLLGAGPSPQPPAAGKDTVAALRERLASDSRYHRGLAVAPDAPHRVLSASVAAWCAAASQALATKSPKLQPDALPVLPATPTPLDAANAALAACHQVVYGLPVVMAAAALDDRARGRLSGRLAAWVRLRTELTDAITHLAGTPVAAEPFYAIGVPAGAGAARAEAARLQAAALPHLAVGIDSGPQDVAGPLAAALADAAADLPRWGGEIPRWPGLS